MLKPSMAALGAAVLLSGLTLTGSANASSGPTLARFNNWATQDCITTNSYNDLFSKDCYSKSDARYHYQQWAILPGFGPGYYLLQNPQTRLCLDFYGGTGTNGVVPQPCDKSRARQNWVVANQKILNSVHSSDGRYPGILYDEARTSDIRVTLGGKVTPSDYGRWSQTD